MASCVRRAARLTAIMLLSLVAFDLSSPSLCALDSPSPAQATQQAGGDASSKDAELPAAPTHVDDCFCCSHCVQPGPTLTPLGLTLLRDTFSPPVADGVFSALGAPFHPPRS